MYLKASRTYRSPAVTAVGGPKKKQLLFGYLAFPASETKTVDVISSSIVSIAESGASLGRLRWTLPLSKANTLERDAVSPPANGSQLETRLRG